jgi:hypothetical protein
MLIKLGYIDQNGMESGTRLRTHPLVAMQSHCNSHKAMFSAFCEESYSGDEPTWLYSKLVQWRDHFIAVQGQSTPVTKESVDLSTRSVSAYGGNIERVRLPNGNANFKSVWEIRIDHEYRATIKMLEGTCRYESFIDWSITEFRAGEMIVVEPDGEVIGPTEFDIGSIDAWWEDLEVVEVDEEDDVFVGEILNDSELDLYLNREDDIDSFWQTDMKETGRIDDARGYEDTLKVEEQGFKVSSLYPFIIGALAAALVLLFIFRGGPTRRKRRRRR